MRTEKQIKDANVKSLEEYNNCMDNILGTISMLVANKTIEKYKTQLQGLFIDWWDEQLDFNKQFKKEWTAVNETCEKIKNERKPS